MILPNENAIKAFNEIVADAKSVKITNIGDIAGTLKVTLNVLAHLTPKFSLGSLDIIEDNILIPLNGKGKEVTLTALELIVKIPFISKEVTDDLITAKGTLNGLVYSKYADAPMYFSRTTNTLFNSVNGQIKTGSIPKYLAGAKNLYEKHLKEFMPTMHAIEAERTKLIKESQIGRGFTGAPAEGMKVKIMPYADMVAKHGEEVFNEQITIANAQSPTYGVPFIKFMSFLSEYEATILSINTTSGAVTLECIVDGKNVFDVSEVTIDGEVQQLDPAPKLHETMLIKL